MSITLNKFLKSEGYSSVKLIFLETKHYLIEAKVNGIDGTFILDTGASNSCICTSLEDKFKVQLYTRGNLLSIKGIFAVILPKISEITFCKTANANKLFLIRICQVKGQKNSDVKRVLLEFSFEKSSLDSDSLVIEESRHIYTNKYIDLCQDFYLNM